MPASGLWPLLVCRILQCLWQSSQCGPNHTRGCSGSCNNKPYCLFICMFVCLFILECISSCLQPTRLISESSPWHFVLLPLRRVALWRWCWCRRLDLQPVKSVIPPMRPDIVPGKGDDPWGSCWAVNDCVSSGSECGVNLGGSPDIGQQCCYAFSYFQEGLLGPAEALTEG